ncbi:2192_t:CDS:2 [Rhizophagus irregularis]|nr:2192_t:CDS:2 [Rhizophagus irregularis]
MEQEKIIVVIQLTYQKRISTFNTYTDLLLLKPSYKQVENVYKVTSNPKVFIAYRDKLRDFLSGNVPVQWGKECIGYEVTMEVGSCGINSPVTQFDADVAAPKNLMTRLIKLCGNAIF